MEDYYNVLQVDRKASPKIIHLAFRELSKEYHPDTKNSINEKRDTTIRFQEINEAYEVLSNPNKRSEYDIKLKHGELKEQQRGYSAFVGRQSGITRVHSQAVLYKKIGMYLGGAFTLFVFILFFNALMEIMSLDNIPDGLSMIEERLLATPQHQQVNRSQQTNGNQQANRSQQTNESQQSNYRPNGSISCRDSTITDSPLSINQIGHTWWDNVHFFPELGNPAKYNLIVGTDFEIIGGGVCGFPYGNNTELFVWQVELTSGSRSGQIGWIVEENGSGGRNIRP